MSKVEITKLKERVNLHLSKNKPLNVSRKRMNQGDQCSTPVLPKRKKFGGLTSTPVLPSTPAASSPPETPVLSGNASVEQSEASSIPSLNSNSPSALFLIEAVDSVCESVGEIQPKNDVEKSIETEEIFENVKDKDSVLRSSVSVNCVVEIPSLQSNS